VKILKAELPWSLLAVAWLAADQVLSVREQLRPLLARFPFASCVPFSNSVPLAQATTGSRTGVLLRAAGHEAPADELLAEIEALFALVGPDVLRYADRRRGQRRAMRLERSGADARLLGFPAGRRYPGRGLDSHAAAGRTAGASLWPTAALARRQAPGGGATTQQASVQLLQRDRGADRALPGAGGRPGAAAAGYLAGRTEVRHQLRLVHSAAQAADRFMQ